MTDEEFEKEEEKFRREAQYKEWCEYHELDADSEESRDQYKEYLEETGDGFWKNLDEDDRAGWEDNLLKD